VCSLHDNLLLSLVDSRHASQQRSPPDNLAGSLLRSPHVSHPVVRLLSLLLSRLHSLHRSLPPNRAPNRRICLQGNHLSNPLQRPQPSLLDNLPDILRAPQHRNRLSYQRLCPAELQAISPPANPLPYLLRSRARYRHGSRPHPLVAPLPRSLRHSHRCNHQISLLRSLPVSQVGSPLGSLRLNRVDSRRRSLLASLVENLVVNLLGSQQEGQVVSHLLIPARHLL
jgi:hypothetical protein